MGVGGMADEDAAVFDLPAAPRPHAPERLSQPPIQQTHQSSMTLLGGTVKAATVGFMPLM